MTLIAVKFGHNLGSEILSIMLITRKETSMKEFSLGGKRMNPATGLILLLLIIGYFKEIVSLLFLLLIASLMPLFIRTASVIFLHVIYPVTMRYVVPFVNEVIANFAASSKVMFFKQSDQVRGWSCKKPRRW